MVITEDTVNVYRNTYNMKIPTAEDSCISLLMSTHHSFRGYKIQINTNFILLN